MAPHAQPAVPGGRGAVGAGTMGCVFWVTVGGVIRRMWAAMHRRSGPRTHSLVHYAIGFAYLDDAFPAYAFNNEGIDEARRRAVATSGATRATFLSTWTMQVVVARDLSVAIGELGRSQKVERSIGMIPTRPQHGPDTDRVKATPLTRRTGRRARHLCTNCPPSMANETLRI